MRDLRYLIAFLLILVAAGPATAQCPPGAFASVDGDFVVIATVPQIALPGQRYLFRDGRRGSTADPDTPVSCSADEAVIRRADGASLRWPRIALRETDTRFSSVGSTLAGRLIEPTGAGQGTRPLVVMVHGSERTAALGGPYPYALAAQGISVFVYDKRGTGASEGDYTQNFELLADDAAAAMAEARRMAASRFGRAGYFGGSQGGWIAPLAATRSQADFVAVGFGLVASPIEEDREQMALDARAAGLGDAADALIRRLSDATAGVLLSGFARGYEGLAEVRRDWAALGPRAAAIHGEYSVAMMGMSDADLRRVGRARFDGLGVIWRYDSIAALRRVDVPILWVLAGADREAPIETTAQALRTLRREGRPVRTYVFPDTDHGMFEFTTAADGTRRMTRITDGYLRLLGDWIKGAASGPYGRGRPLD